MVCPFPKPLGQLFASEAVVGLAGELASLARLILAQLANAPLRMGLRAHSWAHAATALRSCREVGCVKGIECLLGALRRA